MEKLTGMAFLNGSFRPATIWHAEGRITEIEPLNCTEADSLPVICSGLIDIHTHGFMKNSSMGGEESIRAMARGLAAHGVTAFLPTTITASVEDTHNAVSGIAAAMKSQSMEHVPEACILGTHLEGPFINKKYKGAHDENLIKNPSVDLYEAMTHGFSDCVRIITLAPELEGANELIAWLAKHGVIISCGHSAATSEYFHESVDRGITHVTHLFNAMSPLHHREPGVVGAALSDPRVTVELIADGIHLHPTALALAAKLKNSKCVLITDAMDATGLGDGEYTLGGLEVVVKDGAARLLSGALAGSTLTLDRAISNMIKWGASACEAVQMATSTPAKLLGLTDRGLIAPGMRADFAVFDSQFKHLQTYIGGKCL